MKTLNDQFRKDRKNTSKLKSNVTYYGKISKEKQKQKHWKTKSKPIAPTLQTF